MKSFIKFIFFATISFVFLLLSTAFSSKKVGYQMPYLVDSNSELADQLAAKTTPHVYAFNPESKLIYTGSIDNSWDSKREKTIPYLENIISEMKASGIISTEPSVPRGCSIKRVKSKK